MYVQVFFIESVCDDPEIIEANIMVRLYVIKLLIMLDYKKYFWDERAFIIIFLFFDSK